MGVEHSRGRTGKGLLLPVLAAGTVGLAGCGGSSTLSHAQLVSKGNSACQATNATIAALPAPGTLKDLSSYADSTRAATTQLRHKLASLKAPTADQAGVKKYLAALAQGDVLLGRISTAAARGESSAVSALGSELAALPTSTLASAVGLSQCATSPTGIAG